MEMGGIQRHLGFCGLCCKTSRSVGDIQSRQPRLCTGSILDHTQGEDCALRSEGLR